MGLTPCYFSTLPAGDMLFFYTMKLLIHAITTLMLLGLAQTSPTGGASLSGIVVRSGTEEPLAGAQAILTVVSPNPAAGVSTNIDRHRRQPSFPQAIATVSAAAKLRAEFHPSSRTGTESLFSRISLPDSTASRSFATSLRGKSTASGLPMARHWRYVFPRAVAE
jgi:hypothetical protein